LRRNRFKLTNSSTIPYPKSKLPFHIGKRLSNEENSLYTPRL
jgi:hypothetical protein